MCDLVSVGFFHRIVGHQSTSWREQEWRIGFGQLWIALRKMTSVRQFNFIPEYMECMFGGIAGESIVCIKQHTLIVKLGT